MNFQNDYERLAYYEAKMNYYGSKLEDIDGGDVASQLKLTEEIAALTIQINEKKNTIDNLDKQKKLANTELSKLKKDKTTKETALSKDKSKTEIALKAMSKAGMTIPTVPNITSVLP